jgi:hypothetical protein
MGEETWFRGEAVGVAQMPGKTNPHDFVDGMYLTDRVDVAVKYSEVRTTDPNARRVWSVAVDPGSLKILDLTKDPRWQKYMQPVAPGLPSNETLIKQANENYGRLFKSFVAKEKINLEQYDAIIGLEYVRGGRQMCILNKSGRPTPLQAKLRSQFRPQFTRSGTLPSSAARPGVMGGKIGPGLKVAGGMVAMLALQFLVEFIWAKILGKMLEDEMRKLEPTISAEVSSHIQEIAELLSNGKRAFAIVTVTITEGSFGLPEGGSAPLPPKAEFVRLLIGDHEEKGEGPERVERAFRAQVTHHDVTYSFEVTLPPAEVDLYRAYKLEMQWYDEQVRDRNPAKQDFDRLVADRANLAAKFNRALTP